MLVSIDRAGRIVVPKEVRERFDLGPDAQLELEADHTGIHLRPLQPSRRAIVEAEDGLPVIPATGTVRSTDADVQSWRDADQR